MRNFHEKSPWSFDDGSGEGDWHLLESLVTEWHSTAVKMTLDLKPAAARIVKSVSREKRITLVEAASELILKAIPEPLAKIGRRHGIPLARNDGVRMTAEEVAVTLNDG